VEKIGSIETIGEIHIFSVIFVQKLIENS
jgi:hypothetical protein